MRENERGPLAVACGGFEWTKAMADPVRFVDLDKTHADALFAATFGMERTCNEAVKAWCDQPIRMDPETGVIWQRRAGPCACIAPVQARAETHRRFGTKEDAVTALRRAVVDALWCAGGRERAALVATRRALHEDKHEMIAAVDLSLEGAVLDTSSQWEESFIVARVSTKEELENAVERAQNCLESPLGALLLLLSALESRGVERAMMDRDDASHPLVTPPFGHASQEVVHLLLCGKAVSNVFNGTITLGESPGEGAGQALVLQGVPSHPEVGLITMLEFLRYCEVGSFLKRPKYPVWVVGSESHYTVLYCEDEKLQDLDRGQAMRRWARERFDALDQSGGGGFIPAESLEGLLEEIGVALPAESLQALKASAVVLWTELLNALAAVDPQYASKNNTAVSFELVHVNNILKKDASGSLAPRICHIRVAVPPPWEECMDGEAKAAALLEGSQKEGPLVDCIRTRWHRALCSWTGEDPSIV